MRLQTVTGFALLVLSGCGLFVGKGPGDGTQPSKTESETRKGIPLDLCRRLKSCGCQAVRYEGSEAGSCEQAAQALAAAWIDAALAAELTHDGVCSLIGPWTYCDEINYDSATRCQIYSGAGGLGEACEAFGPYMSSCARDLACGVDDICYDAVDLPIEGALGHRCGIPLGDYTECAPELACVEGRCVTAAAADGECDDERPCGDTYWCDEGLCAREANVSKPCTTDEGCYSGMCEDGSCLIEQPRGCRGFFW